MSISTKAFSAWEPTDVLLIEADGKTLLAQHGVAVPTGVLVTAAPAEYPGAGPWMVKAQVPIGGRGKAGGVV
jgi:succinyl-CoA synthetase beta subunit